MDAHEEEIPKTPERTELGFVILDVPCIRTGICERFLPIQFRNLYHTGGNPPSRYRYSSSGLSLSVGGAVVETDPVHLEQFECCTNSRDSGSQWSRRVLECKQEIICVETRGSTARWVSSLRYIFRNGSPLNGPPSKARPSCILGTSSVTQTTN